MEKICHRCGTYMQCVIGNYWQCKCEKTRTTKLKDHISVTVTPQSPTQGKSFIPFVDTYVAEGWAYDSSYGKGKWNHGLGFILNKSQTNPSMVKVRLTVAPKSCISVIRDLQDYWNLESLDNTFTVEVIE